MPARAQFFTGWLAASHSYRLTTLGGGVRQELFAGLEDDARIVGRGVRERGDAGAEQPEGTGRAVAEIGVDAGRQARFETGFHEDKRLGEVFGQTLGQALLEPPAVEGLAAGASPWVDHSPSPRVLR